MRECKCGAPLDYAAADVKACYSCRQMTMAKATRIVAEDTRNTIGGSIVDNPYQRWGIMAPSIGQWVNNKGNDITPYAKDAMVFPSKDAATHFRDNILAAGVGWQVWVLP